MLKNEVPILWKSYPCLKPLASWVNNLVERILFIRDWLAIENPNAFWMSGLFYPQGFLTGVKQTYARKHELEINKLDFSFKCLEWQEKEMVPEPPMDGVYVYGLFLEGAKLDRKKKSLAEQSPGELYWKMPVIWFLPMLIEEMVKPKHPPYISPCYKTSLRQGVLSTTGQSTNFILSVNLPTTDKPPNHWTKRGAALLT